MAMHVMRARWKIPQTLKCFVIALLGMASTVAPAVDIGPGFTGAWFNPQQSGHGLFLEVLPQNQLLAFWFTFNPDGTQQAWFGGVGTYSGNTASVPVALTMGGRWIPNFDGSKIVNDPWGTLTFTFSDCNSGRVEFTSTYLGYGSNHMDLTRLTSPAGLACTSSSNASAAKGVWVGTTNLNETVIGIVLEDGTFYFDYSKPGTATDAAVVQGTSTAAESGAFSSADAKNFPIAQKEEGAGAATVVSVGGNYTPRGVLQLAIDGMSGARTISATYVPGSEQPASVSAVAGHYVGLTGHVSGRRTATFAIDVSGNISGTNDAGCGYTGTIVPRASVHAFDWTLVATNDGCFFGSGPIFGVLHYDETTKEVRAFAQFANRIEQYFIIATKN